MSNQPRPPSRFSNIAILFYFVAWTALTVPFIGYWSFALPISLGIWVLWKANQADRQKLREEEEERLYSQLRR